MVCVWVWDSDYGDICLIIVVWVYYVWVREMMRVWIYWVYD